MNYFNVLMKKRKHDTFILMDHYFRFLIFILWSYFMIFNLELKLQRILNGFTSLKSHRIQTATFEEVPMV